jgi:Bacterial Ig-like domain (group 3)/FG-GAP-like repeat
MTRKFTRNTSVLRGIAPFIAVLTVMTALAALAQVTGAGRPSWKADAVLAQLGASSPRAERPPIPGTDGDGRFPVGRSHARRHGPVHPNSNTPLFFPAVGYDSGGDAAASVAAADVNGDGKPDVIVANACGSSSNCKYYQSGFDGTVAVLLGNGDGTFQPAVAYASGGETPISVAVADVNRDGRPDIIVANECASGTNCNSGNGSVGILLGNGDGTFQAVATYNSGGFRAVSLAVADLNGDGKLDLAVAHASGADEICCNSPALGVLLANGDGTFQPAVMYGSGGQTSVSVGDVNGDHRPDLVVTSLAVPGVDIFLGKGDGTFQSPVAFDTGSPSPDSVAIADLNGDGKLDLVVDHAPAKAGVNSSLGILLGNGDGTFQRAVIYDSGVTTAGSVAVSDVDGDGNPDLLLAGNSGLGVLLGKFDGTFQAVLTYGSGGQLALSVVAADVNGDGKPDLVTGNVYGNNSVDGAVGVLLNAESQSPTTATLASSVNPSIFGEAVTFTAVVSSSSGTPTGTVVFLDGSTSLGRGALVNGRASISISSLALGSHSITAAYQGSFGFSPSTSASLNQGVSKATSAISVASSVNPAFVNKSVTYTATVNSQYGGAVTGTVTFQDGGVTIATVALAGNQAAYTTSYTTAGVHSITATYSGDGNNTGSTSATLTETIWKPTVPSKTVVTTSGSPSILGQPVTFTAKVTTSHGTIPDGELVTFYDGTKVLGSAALASGTAAFTTSALSVKKHTVKGAYAGDATFQPSRGAVTQVVNPYPTTTTLTSSPNPSTFGQNVTFTATVTSAGPTPGGLVKFLDGTTGIGLESMSRGVAKLTKSTLPVGTHPITAQYLGDAVSGKSTSPVVTQVVQ